MFGLKAWGNPFKKMSTVRLFERLVFKGYKGVFFALEYRKRHIPSLYLLKKKLEKWPFWKKTMGEPLWKISNFRMFELVFFID